MKSAAFNLAFKVHRNELSFAEGLLRSVESEAQEDFIEALNSLAGETKYDVDQLETLIDQAHRSAMQDSAPAPDLSSIKQEIDTLRKKQREIGDSIQTYESQKSVLVPTVLPGVNSVLLGLGGMMISVVALFIGGGLFFIMGVSVSLIVAIVLFIQDMGKLTIQKEKIRRRVEKIDSEIVQLEDILGQLDEKISEQVALFETYSSGATPSSNLSMDLDDPSL
jgi:chromosome segregation ATPase